MNKKCKKALQILSSIKSLSMEDGDLMVWQDDDTFPAGINSFKPGSLTREILETIESHLIFKDGK